MRTDLTEVQRGLTLYQSMMRMTKVLLVFVIGWEVSDRFLVDVVDRVVFPQIKREGMVIGLSRPEIKKIVLRQEGKS